MDLLFTTEYMKKDKVKYIRYMLKKIFNRYLWSEIIQ